jgi:hypothetical protein
MSKIPRGNNTCSSHGNFEIPDHRTNTFYVKLSHSLLKRILIIIKDLY